MSLIRLSRETRSNPQKVPLFGEDEIQNHVRLARDLYRAILRPACDSMRGKHHIVVIPDGNLFYCRLRR